MKKFTLAALSMIFFICAAHKTNAQAFTTENLHINLGVGFGGYYSYGYGSGNFSQTPMMFASFDKGIVDDWFNGTIGIGAFLGYKSASWDYSYGTYMDKAKWTTTVIGARGTYHPYLSDKWDVYAGLHLGLYLLSYDYTYGDPTYSFDNDFKSTDLYYSVIVGAKYFFTDKIGVFAELGYDLAYLKAGISISL